MPSKRQYNLVQNDDFDTRIPLYPEDAFHHGITFLAKYIGTLDVPRPTSRVEIVAAMRRIRYEFKAKGVKKKKVLIEVSIDGVSITLRKKKKKNQQWLNDNKLLIMSHPIYRIFYVSHDSQDLKIFSYIARDGSTNVFKCHVFKSTKKSQAMRIVRTVGQAFEVCHKLSIHNPSSPEHGDDGTSEKSSETLSEKPKKDVISDQNSCDTQTEELVPVPEGDNTPTLPRPDKLEPLTVTEDNKEHMVAGETFSSPLSEPLKPIESIPPSGTPLSIHHELQLLRERVEQQQQETQAAMAQVHLLRDQLAAETAARMEAQARTHQLLVQNKELLQHIQMMILQMHDLENRVPASQAPPVFQQTGTGQGQQQVALLPQENNTGSEALSPHSKKSPQEENVHSATSLNSFSSDSEHGRTKDSSLSSTENVINHQDSSKSSSQETHSKQGLVTHFESLNVNVNSDLMKTSPPTQKRSNGPFFSRSVSEKVTKKEPLLSQVQRTVWARHTTK